MPTPIIYDQATITLDGSFAIEATSVALSFSDSDSLVHVLGGYSKGWTTLSPGIRWVEVQFSSMVPASDPRDILGKKGPDSPFGDGDFETSGFDIIGKYLDFEKVTLGLVLLGSGKRLVSTGHLRAPSLSASAGRAMSMSASFVGPVSKWL